MGIYHQDKLRLHTEQQLISELNFGVDYLEELIVEIMARRKPALHDLARAKLVRLQLHTIRQEMING